MKRTIVIEIDAIAGVYNLFDSNLAKLIESTCENYGARIKVTVKR